MNATTIEQQPEMFAPMQREIIIGEIDATANAMNRVYQRLPEDVRAEVMQLGHTLSSLRRKLAVPLKISDADVPQ